MATVVGVKAAAVTRSSAVTKGVWRRAEARLDVRHPNHHSPHRATGMTFDKTVSPKLKAKLDALLLKSVAVSVASRVRAPVPRIALQSSVYN